MSGAVPEPRASVAERAQRRFDRLARAAAGGVSDAVEAEPDRELLVAWLGEDPYALPIERVREILRMRPITPMPRVPACVLGVLSLRGEIVQVVDVRRRLGLPPAPGDAGRRRIVVIASEDGQLSGLLVDRVSEVLRLREDALRPPTSREARAVAALAPHAGGFVSVFDVDRVLDLGEG
jgi:purine-binding chemotaxis protein CheW